MRRLLELTAMLMLGDALLALAAPRRHARLWEGGPRPVRRTMRAAARRPWATRAFAAAELALGGWLAYRQLAR